MSPPFKIEQMIRNKRDRTFLRIAVKSTEKVFVSHDFKDFPDTKPRDIKSKLQVHMPDAEGCRTLLA